MTTKATQPKKEVSVRAQPGLPAEPGSFAEHAGAGFENASREHFSIPFLQILQSLSPHVDESNAAYVEGAKVGMIYNTVSKELVEDLIVIPAHHIRSFIEWVPRDKGGGFRGEHSEAEALDEFNKRRDKTTGKAITDDGNELADTRTFYVLVERESGGYEPAVISMGSTQIKTARDWYAFMRMREMLRGDGTSFVPAMYASRFKLTTRQQSNKKGKWHGWVWEWLGFVNSTQEPGYQKAIGFAKMAEEGKAQIDRTQMEAPGAEAEEPETM